MTNSLIDRWIRPEIQALTAYTVPDSSGMIKLDAMENPYSWPEELMNDWCERLKSANLNRYPDPHSTSLKALLAENMGVPETQSVMLGNGSDEIIQISAMAVAGSGRVILAPEPGFAMYRMICAGVGMRFQGVNLIPADFSLDMPAMRNAIKDSQPAVIFLAYPNNPTGNLWQRRDIEEIIGIAPGVVIVDEAYAPFASDSFITALGNYDNLLVMRTVSKMGLAGLRLGMLAGNEILLNEFNKLRLPYNTNTLTQISAEYALEHSHIFAEQAAVIRQSREQLFSALNAIEGIHAWPSEANFILFRVPEGLAQDIFDYLKEHGVLIKNLCGQSMLSGCLRVTVGKPEENSMFINVLEEAMTNLS